MRLRRPPASDRKRSAAMTRKRTLIAAIGLAILAAFLGWRLVRPMNIFVVSEGFERPMDTSSLSAPPETRRAGAGRGRGRRSLPPAG